MKVEDIRWDTGEPDQDTEKQEPAAPSDVRRLPHAIVRDFSSQGFGALGDFKEGMSDLKDALEDIKSFGGPEARKKAERLIRSVDEFKPSITMIGQIKAGKTSLVNAMVGMPDLLPADVNPWTSVVTSLHLNAPVMPNGPTASFQLFDQEEWDHLVEKGGRLGELSSRAGADDEVEKVRDQIQQMREKTKARLGRKFELLLGQTHNYKYLDDALMQRYVCMGDDFDDPDMNDPQGQFADITKSADLNIKSPGVPIPLTIRDTPGVNDTFMMREQITINALRTSRICVVVLSATQALNSVDMGLIRLISNVKSREVIIFVNRIDELANPAQAVGEIRESILTTLADNNGPENLTVLFGSAYWANMALLGETADLDPESARALVEYGTAFGETDAEADPAVIWKLSGVPALFDAIGERVAEGEGEEMMRATRRRALNHLQGLQASSAIVSLRLEESELEMVDTPTLLASLDTTDARLLGEMDTALGQLFESYEARIDQAHKRFLDRALESLLEHLETKGENELWQYSPDGLRMLLRSSYQMMRKKAEHVTDAAYASAARAMTETYINMLSIKVDNFAVTPPEVPAFPPPVTLGQTIALDLQTAWWKGWWQRRRGYRTYADEFYKLIEAETAPMIHDMKVTQTSDIRRIALAELQDFLAEQRGILADVTQKSQISLGELQGLFGITAQEERDALFEILFEEFGSEEPEGFEDVSTVTPTRPSRPSRPTRPGP
ncbi:MAG: dynamin family protein [Pseudomonadota bacterium]